MKKLGIIGGLGPMATAYFLELLVQMTKADCDQEHIEMIVYNCPNIPDRTNYILGKSKENPLPYFVSIAQKLKEEQAELVAIPCMTAHYFHKELEEKSKISIINAVSETANYLKKRGYHKVGIMATDATIKKGIFSKQLAKFGIDSVCPNENEQKMVMELIYQNIKSGKSIQTQLFEQVSNALFEQGAEVILLGCTELSIIKKNHKLTSNYLDVLEVLAKICVEQCGNLKEEYKELITT